ncbi:MAG: NADH:ubiquinone oxidoreductase subunit NDUFA12 [Halocynthiibacter sp.]
MRFILSLLTWWHSHTLGTRLFTWRKGVQVGEDEFGNRFFETRDGKRRWVLFDGEPEASKVSPDWHGWLHHTFKEPPTKRPLVHKSWELPHQENLTGTAAAYTPVASMPKTGERRDYDAWQPE